jgi:hypothetical protein
MNVRYVPRISNVPIAENGRSATVAHRLTATANFRPLTRRTSVTVIGESTESTCHRLPSSRSSLRLYGCTGRLIVCAGGIRNFGRYIVRRLKYWAAGIREENDWPVRRNDDPMR